MITQQQTIAAALKELDSDRETTVAGVRVTPGGDTHRLLSRLAAHVPCVYCERRLAGIAKAQAEGKFPGGAPGAGLAGDPVQARELYEQGLSLREVGRRLGISHVTVARYVRQETPTARATVRCTSLQSGVVVQSK